MRKNIAMLTPLIVQSIATSYANVNQADINGNITQQSSTFTRTDGCTGNSEAANDAVGRICA